jgi:anti-sigma regulatory factor (Ser/Thr protein kinase)
MSPVADVDGERRLNMSLTIQPGELRRIRRTVIRRLRDWGFDAIANEAVLVVTELLTNVHEHAEGACELDIQPMADQLIVRVSDAMTTLPAMRRPSSSAEAGRGLVLVDTLTDHWETAITDTGKVVTCSFRTPSGPIDGSDP